MCMQCMASAMTAGAAVTGARSWLAAHSPPWMTPKRLKIATATLLAGGVLAAGSHMSPAPSPIAETHGANRTEDQRKTSGHLTFPHLDGEQIGMAVRGAEEGAAAARFAGDRP